MLQFPDKPKAVSSRTVVQALCIPRGFEFDGAEAVLWCDGDRLVIEPVRQGGLLDLLARLPPLPDEFPDVDDALGRSTTWKSDGGVSSSRHDAR